MVVTVCVRLVVVVFLEGERVLDGRDVNLISVGRVGVSGRGCEPDYGQIARVNLLLQKGLITTRSTTLIGIII